MSQRSPEYWKSRTYDVAYYALILCLCGLRWQRPSSLMKANYGLPLGGTALASKFAIQEHIGADKFVPTDFLPASQSFEQTQDQIINFANQHGYPVVLKPDSGFTGKGIFKIKQATEIKRARAALEVDYLVQVFVPGEIEFGLFYVRHQGKIKIPSINQKFFPTVTGDGRSDLGMLAQKDQRYSELWQTFLQHHDLTEVLPAGEKKVLSFLGSNTLGAKFTDVTALQTPQIESRLRELFADNPGYNFGRLDVKADSVIDFQAGTFVIIEANGIMSQPTNMLDPSSSFWSAVKIWYVHADYLLKVAREHQEKIVKTLSLWSFIRQSKRLIDQVEHQHQLTKNK